MTLCGYQPDQWQRGFLESTADQVLLLCSRQCGKTFVTAALALRTALLQPSALCLILSPSERQSGLFVDQVRAYYRALNSPVKIARESALQLHLANGSRIIGLPESERTIRGYSGATLLIVDEAARVDESLYTAVRPMLSVSRGRLVCLSTPFGKRGWFFNAWNKSLGWEKVLVTAYDCPRHSRDFLDRERHEMPIRDFEQEYLCIFHEAEDSVFRHEDIQAMFANGAGVPLFGGIGQSLTLEILARPGAAGSEFSVIDVGG